jgi:hypothetical protein
VAVVAVLLVDALQLQAVVEALGYWVRVQTALEEQTLHHL